MSELSAIEILEKTLDSLAFCRKSSAQNVIAPPTPRVSVKGSDILLAPPKMPTIPGLPTIPGFPAMPGFPAIPEFPSMPKFPAISQFPPIPELPQIREFPPIPELPQIREVPPIPELPTIYELPKTTAIPREQCSFTLGTYRCCGLALANKLYCQSHDYNESDQDWFDSSSSSSTNFPGEPFKNCNDFPGVDIPFTPWLERDEAPTDEWSYRPNPIDFFDVLDYDYSCEIINVEELEDDDYNDDEDDFSVDNNAIFMPNVSVNSSEEEPKEDVNLSESLRNSNVSDITDDGLDGDENSPL